MKIPSDIKSFCKIFNNSNYKCYLVGGAVRNLLTGEKHSDYDFATDARPEEVIKLFRRVIPTGLDHGTVTVLFKNHSLEVTTFRIDGKYSNSRHPDKITYSSSIMDDLTRRDFTINAIALDPVSKELLDPQNGIADLDKKIIRAIGNPEDRFAEDGLRVLRACRFAATLDFEIEEKTLAGMYTQGDRLKLISAERIRDELIKILYSNKPSKAFKIMNKVNILQHIIPELEEGIGMNQRELHKFDVFEHSLYSCDFAEKKLDLRLAALLHDIGKPRCLKIMEDTPTFYNHEIVSSDMAGEILARLKFPKTTTKNVKHLILYHMFNYNEEWTDGALRKLISRVGKENIKNLIALRNADRAGMAGTESVCPYDTSFITRINRILEKENSFTIKNLDIDGNILSEVSGIPKGPLMGKVLDFLLESVLEDPSLNTRDKLSEIAFNFYKTRIDI